MKASTVSAAAALVFLLVIFVSGMLWPHSSHLTDLTSRNLPPATDHLFGTDWLGRDMFGRTLQGLSLSLMTGLAAALAATLMATLAGMVAGMRGGRVDSVLCWLIDLFMGLPHLVFLILVSFALGGGTWGVVTAIAVSHWPRLARVIRAETLALRQSDFVRLASRLGSSKATILRRHLLPNVAPQAGVGLVLLFPHVLVHEAGLSFIGLGMPPHSPAIGIILAESMRHLTSGRWWLAVLPGVGLISMILVIEHLGTFCQNRFLGLGEHHAADL